MSIVLLIAGLILFLGLVVVHEWGHFIVAKRRGVQVEEFGIGFPPRLFKKQTAAGWVFTINLLPLGGFVRLKGEHDTDTEAGSFGAASVRTKAAIIAAGILMNLVVAYVLLVLLAVVGMPQLVSGQFLIHSDAHYIQHVHQSVAVDTVEAASPAAQVGIKANDTIVSMGLPGHLRKITDVNALPGLTRRYAGKTVLITYQDSTGKTIQKTITLRTNQYVQVAKRAGKQTGYLGISAYESQQGMDVVRSTWSAPIVAGGVMGQYTALTFQGLGKAVAGLGSTVAGLATHNTTARVAGQTEASSQVAGPVGIFFVLKDGSTLGYRFMLFIIAILSLTLAIMNILPIPALDGGRLWLMLATRAIKKSLTPAREELINTAGFAFLFGLIILVTIVDVRRFF